jgi:hypothetical protein
MAKKAAPSLAARAQRWQQLCLHRVQLAHLHGFRRYGDTSTLQQLAGKHADIQTLSALRAAGMRFQNPLLRGAADSADLSKLIWLYTEQRCALPDDITYRAAKCGSIKMLDWLQSIGYAATTGAFTLAAQAGHMHVLKHLQRVYSSSCAWDAATSFVAARKNDWDMLHWLITAGCPWDSRTCDMVIARNDVFTLSMLCERNSLLCARCAVEGGSMACMEFVIEQVRYNTHLYMYSTQVDMMLYSFNHRMRTVTTDNLQALCVSVLSRYANIVSARKLTTCMHMLSVISIGSHCRSADSHAERCWSTRQSSSSTVVANCTLYTVACCAMLHTY